MLLVLSPSLPYIVIPAPSELDICQFISSRCYTNISISSTSNLDDLTIVSVPLTVKFPSIITLLPNVVIPAIFALPPASNVDFGNVLPIPTPSLVVLV